MPRKDNSPAISFFSFQDIITSITGIMFLVVLILVLLVVTRTQNSPAVKVNQEVLRLRQMLKQLQQQAAAQAAGNRRMQQRIEELKKADAASLPRRKEQLLQKIRQSSVLLEREERSAAELEKEKKRLEKQMNELIASKKRAQKANQDTETLLQQEAARRKQHQTELEKNRTLIRFVWKHDLGKTPVLAVCGKDGISVQNAKDGKLLHTLRNTGDVPAMLKEFVDWCQGAGNIYVVLLAKPSGFDYLEILSGMLGQAGIERGREVLPSEDDPLPGGQP